jgi:metal-responsive CopG/Arc/MetJ family transcriptional regulator
MATNKIAITIDEKLVSQLDRLVAERRFPNRSRAIQEALEEKLERMAHNRLSHEVAKLDRRFEQMLADEGLVGSAEEWPEY